MHFAPTEEQQSVRDLARRFAIETIAPRAKRGSGYARACKVERLMRDAKICQIYDGTSAPNT